MDVRMLRKLRRFGVCKFILLFIIPTVLICVTLKSVIYLVRLQRATHSATEKDCPLVHTKRSAIPKIIHQTWKDQHIPKQWSVSVQSCKQKNTNYKYILWTDEGLELFLARNYPWFLKTYHSYPYIIQKIDAARLFVLYHYGGIYMDLDIVCLKSWDHVLRNRTTYDNILVETTPWGVTNYIMATKPRDPFIWYLIEGLQNSQNKWYIIKYTTVIFSTGPMMVSDRLLSWSNPHKVQVIDLRERDETFGNLHGSSWHTWDGVIIYGIHKHYDLILKVALFVGSIFCVTIFVAKRLMKASKELKVETAMLT